MKTRPLRSSIATLALILLATGVLRAADHWKVVTGEAFSFTEVRDGVWHVRGTGAVAAGSNGALVVGDGGALLVDSHMTPAAARALLAELPLVTDQPIRYVVNTHFHFDHVQGNQVFGEDVEVVAHEATRAHIASGDTRRGRGYELFVGGIPGAIEQLEAGLAGLEGEELETAQARIAGMRTFWEQDSETELKAPTLALREAVTLYRGGREIRIFHLGRGHTDGDVLVYLPAERVLVTGDVITNGVPYMGDGFLREWADSLEPLTELPIDVILPGHGAAFEGSERIAHLQAYLRDLWAKCAALHAEGVAAAEAAERIDMTAHAEHFPTIEGPGVHPHAVERVYELLAADRSMAIAR